VAYTALAGLTTHTFFDGVSLAAGFLISPWLGTVIFGATILHNVPEGFTMASIMVAANRSSKAGMTAVSVLAVSRILGVLAMALAYRWANYGLALSAGVTLYVAASDLIPEVNKMRRPKYALAVAAGVALVLAIRYLFFNV
jgi:ZIP family zinc transporter/zinc and cadmium transporter